MRLILFVSLPLYALDQLTKNLVLRYISPYEARIIVPDFFSLVNVTNTGAAFGSFKGNNVFFILISIIALVVVTILLVRRRLRDAWRDLSLALLLTGILGNLTDRLHYGHVIDFLLFNLHVRYADPCPAFNIAYFAGGCVRDIVRRVTPKDDDVATSATPETVQKLFPRTHAVGAHFGVIIVLENGFQFEVATFRSDDAYIDGRHPTAVHFSSP